jgi:hypothetical protein
VTFNNTGGKNRALLRNELVLSSMRYGKVFVNKTIIELVSRIQDGAIKHLTH